MNNENQTVEVTTPLGKIRARGSDIIHTISLVVLCLIAYVLYDHKNIEKDKDIEIVKAINQSATDQKIAIENAAEAQIELNYLMTLTTEERKRLNIEMPDSLRKRMRER